MKSGTSGVPPQSLRRTRFSIVIPALSAFAALVLLAGCGGGGGSSSGTSTTGGTTTGGTTTGGTTTGGTTGGTTGAAASVSAPALSNFTATLSEDQAAIGVGGTVNYTLTLANTSSSAATLVTTTSGGVTIPVVSLSIANAAGQAVYPPSAQPGLKPLDGPPAPPGGGPLTLQPGQSVSVTRAVSVFGTAGTYQAIATFRVAALASDTPQVVTLSPLAVAVK